MDEAAKVDGAAMVDEAATPGEAARASDVAIDAEAANVLRRLDRIDALAREDVSPPPGALLGELRALVREAEAWARLEGDARAASAVEKLREGAEGMS